jgi:hypothetical protein
MTKPILLILCLFAVTTASANTITITESGTWSNNCPAPFCTAVGATWSYSFEVAAPPTIIKSYADFFLASISDFTFSDDGIVQAALTDSETEAYFFDAADGGGFATFDDLFDVSTLGQFFTGSGYSPTFIPGNYAVIPGPTVGNQMEYPNGDITVSGAAPAPEPATWGLMLTGLGLVWMRKRVVPAFRPNTPTNC